MGPGLGGVGCAERTRAASDARSCVRRPDMLGGPGRARARAYPRPAKQTAFRWSGGNKEVPRPHGEHVVTDAGKVMNPHVEGNEIACQFRDTTGGYVTFRALRALNSTNKIDYTDFASVI